jgi:hypothetical protein
MTRVILHKSIAKNHSRRTGSSVPRRAKRRSRIRFEHCRDDALPDQLRHFYIDTRWFRAFQAPYLLFIEIPSLHSRTTSPLRRLALHARRNGASNLAACLHESEICIRSSVLGYARLSPSSFLSFFFSDFRDNDHRAYRKYPRPRYANIIHNGTRTGRSTFLKESSISGNNTATVF